MLVFIWVNSIEVASTCPTNCRRGLLVEFSRAIESWQTDWRERDHRLFLFFFCTLAAQSFDCGKDWRFSRDCKYPVLVYRSQTETGIRTLVGVKVGNCCEKCFSGIMMDAEKSCYDNGGFVMTEKNICMNKVGLNLTT